MVAAADCRAWAGRVLQRRNRCKDPRGGEEARRAHERRRLEPVFGGMGGADFHDVSRLDRFRIASQRAGHGGAGNAKYSGSYAAWTKRLRIRDSEGASPDD